MKLREGLRYLAYGDVPQEMKADFDTELARRNIHISWWMLSLVLAIELYNIWRVFFRASGLSTPANRAYFSLYILLALVSLAGLLVAWLVHRSVERHTRLILGCTFAYLALLCLWGDGITLLDMRKSIDLMNYSNIIIGVSIFFYLRPWQYLAILAGNHILFWVLAPMVRPEIMGESGYLINSTILVVVSAAMGMSRYYGRAADYKNRTLLSKQNQQIKQINVRLREQVLTDTLSGLYNRRFLEKGISQRWELAAQAGTEAAVIMLDVDNFKHYNDYYGHHAGDECIRRIAGALTQAVDQKTGCIVRYGGEEFAVILLGVSAARAVEVAEDIRRRVEAMKIQNAYAQGSSLITVSEGVYAAPLGAGARLEEFLKMADRALYRAKREGKNRVAVYDGRPLEG